MMPATWSIIHGTEIRKRGRGITIGGTLYFWRQLVIVVLVGIVALYFTLIAFGNITDYGTNFAFVSSSKYSSGFPLPVWCAMRS